MTRARDLAVVAGFLLWWSPALAIMALRAAPHLAARRGAPYRIRRAHRLLDRGRVDEAERVLRALHRDRDAAERWGKVGPASRDDGAGGSEG